MKVYLTLQVKGVDYMEITRTVTAQQMLNYLQSYLDAWLSDKEKYGMEIPAELRPGDKASVVYFRFQQELAAAQYILEAS